MADVRVGSRTVEPVRSLGNVVAPPSDGGNDLRMVDQPGTNRRGAYRRPRPSRPQGDGADHGRRPDGERTAIAWLRRQSRYVGSGVVGVVGGAAAVAGTGHLAWPWILATVSLLTVMGGFVGAAVEPDTAAVHQRRDLAAALVVALALLGGSFLYNRYWDPSKSAEPKPFRFVVGGGDANLVRPVAEPGGTDVYAFAPLPGGSAVAIRCAVSFRGELWFELFDEPSFLPSELVHAPAGLPTPRPPACTTPPS